MSDQIWFFTSEVKAEPTVANVDPDTGVTPLPNPDAHRFSLTDLNTVLIATSVALPVLFEFSRNTRISSAFTTLLETFGYDSSLDNDHSSPKP